MSRFVSASAEHNELVARFNQRLRQGGWEQQFSCEPGRFHDHDPHARHNISTEKFLALDKQGEMRAGYYLKHQRYRLSDAEHDLGNIVLPISEGIVNTEYAAYGLALVQDALRRNPLCYSLGIGGASEPYLRLLQAMRWRTAVVPFFFKVLKPFRFCRRIAYLRAGSMPRLALDVLAFSGLGWIGLRFAQRLKTSRPAWAGVTADGVEHFGAWSDLVWQRSVGAYGLLGVRSADVLNFLYREPRFLRVRVCADGEPVGWAVCLSTPFTSHRQFGSLHVGSLVDCLAVSGWEHHVVTAAADVLDRSGADLIVTNLSHRAWCGAVSKCGFLRGPSNFALALSPRLQQGCDERGIALEQIHMTRGDGDGPIHL